MEEVMKEIIIKCCGDCPQVEFKPPKKNETDTLFCGVVEKEIDSFQEVYSQKKFKFPEFCPLADFGTEIKWLIAEKNTQENTIFDGGRDGR